MLKRSDIDQLTAPLVERVLSLFGRPPCRMQVAALPWRTTKKRVEVLLVTSRDTGRWVLPKGWPEEGEELFDAAAREAMEEAGITGRVARHEAGRYTYTKLKARGGDIACEVIVFPLDVARVADKWKERGQRKRRWFSAERAAELVAEPELAALISAFGEASLPASKNRG